MYDSTNRVTDNRKANFSNNFKQLYKNDWIVAQNDNDNLMTEKGAKTAAEILNRQHGSVNKKGSGTTKKTKIDANNASKDKSSTSKSYKVLDINFRPEKKVSLLDFATKYKLTSLPEYVLVIVYYLEKTLMLSPITVDHIHTGLKELKQRIPPTLDQQIRNVKSRKHWLKFDSTNDILVSIQGSNHLEFDLTKS